MTRDLQVPIRETTLNSIFINQEFSLDKTNDG